MADLYSPDCILIHYQQVLARYFWHFDAYLFIARSQVVDNTLRGCMFIHSVLYSGTNCKVDGERLAQWPGGLCVSSMVVGTEYAYA